VIASLTLLTLIAFTFLSIEQLNPPEALGRDACLNEFSAGRAMKHLAMIASRPHPIGSIEHAEVRQYIVQELRSSGLDPEVQETTAVNGVWGNPFSAGTVHNVVATLKGSETGKSVLLVGHYDSVPTGPGAADDGAAVATMLETLRALKTGESLKNDVIFLFTDGEEVGLLGAHAFVDQHPWAKSAGWVINFDARGNNGPVIMFETSPQNGGLIREFAKVAPYPIANSFSYDIYRLLPNNTDFTVFKGANIGGLNFANINGFISYHTQLDSLENMDQRILQHQGSYALALLRHFGNLRLPIPPEKNAVYFNTIGSIFVHYPSSWNLIWALLAGLLFLAVVIVGLRRGRLKISGIIWGFLALLLALISGGAVGTILWWIVRRVHSDERLANQSNTYNSYLYMIGFVLLVAALTSTLYVWFRRRTGVENLAVGGLLWWFILVILSTLLMPGSSYLFTWPLLFSLVALGIVFISKDQRPNSWKQFAVFTVSAIPIILILAPMIYQVFTALAFGMTGIVMVLVVLSLGLLIPQLQMMAAPGRWLLPGVMLMSGLGLLVAGIVTSGFGATHPQSDSLFYGFDADSGRAFWASADRAPDEWTRQVISAQASRATMSEFFPLGTRAYLKEQAPVAALATPQAELLSDSTSEDLRNLHLHIASSRQAPYISVYVEPEVEVFAATVNGQQLKGPNSLASNQGDKEWALFYYGALPEGLDLTFVLKTTKPVKFKVVDRSYGLPETLSASFKPRPNYLMPLINPNNGTTLVSKSFVF
jgi:Zn-dependent M28 family amino/carboxypeptidase